MHVSLVIPAHNESDVLPKSISAILTSFCNQGVSVEIIVVDDGSNDDTRRIDWKELSKLGVRYIRNNRRMGKGSAIRSGLNRAQGDIIGFTDADLPIEPQELARMTTLMPGFGAVVGYRLSNKKAKSSLARTGLSLILHSSLRHTRYMAYVDPQAPAKFLTRESWARIGPHAHLDGYLFDLELLGILDSLAIEVLEVGVSWTDLRGKWTALVSRLNLTEMLWLFGAKRGA